MHNWDDSIHPSTEIGWTGVDEVIQLPRDLELARSSETPATWELGGVISKLELFDGNWMDAGSVQVCIYAGVIYILCI